MEILAVGRTHIGQLQWSSLWQLYSPVNPLWIFLEDKLCCQKSSWRWEGDASIGYIACLIQHLSKCDWQTDMWVTYRELVKVSVVHRTHTAVLRHDYRNFQCTNSCFWSSLLGISSLCCFRVGPVFNQLFIASSSMYFYMLVWTTLWGRHLIIPCIVAFLFFFVLFYILMPWAGIKSTSDSYYSTLHHHFMVMKTREETADVCAKC